MKDLVTLWKRPSYDGETFTYYLLYTDEQGRRRQKSLRHRDAQKAERPCGWQLYPLFEKWDRDIGFFCKNSLALWG